MGTIYNPNYLQDGGGGDGGDGCVVVLIIAFGVALCGGGAQSGVIQSDTSQRDGDGDGVADRFDRCSNSPKGSLQAEAPANVRGCNLEEAARTYGVLPVFRQDYFTVPRRVTIPLRWEDTALTCTLASTLDDTSFSISDCSLYENKK